MNQDLNVLPDEYRTAVEVEKTRPLRYFKAWILFLILSLFGGFGAGMAAGSVIGAIMGAAGQNLQTIATTCRVVGYALGVVVSFICYRWSVQKFIVPQMSAAAETPSP